MNAGIPASIRFADLIHTARLRKASDVHIACSHPVALRIDGSLHSIGDESFDVKAVQALLDDLLPASARAEYERCGDVTVSLPCGDDAKARLHVLRSAGSPAFAIRLLDRQAPPLAQLGLPRAVAATIERERGLVIIAGPTGSGKSTTLASLVEEINATRACRIVSLEDPIEYDLPSRRAFVSQREIGRDAPTLQSALVGALRADPDVLVVGEVREADSMHAALTAAETGNLVFVTLHTGSASETVERVIDMFDAAMQAQARVVLAATLVAVVCQRLVERPKAGRRALVEILVATPAVKSIIRQSKTHLLQNAIATGSRYGMQTFAQHAFDLLACGEISSQTAGEFIEPATPAA